MAKRKLTLLVDGELIQKARNLGLNISRITEKALEDAIYRLDSIRMHTYNNIDLRLNENHQNEHIIAKSGQILAGGEGFEPPSQAPEACALSWLGYGGMVSIHTRPTYPRPP